MITHAVFLINNQTGKVVRLLDVGDEPTCRQYVLDYVPIGQTMIVMRRFKSPAEIYRATTPD